MPVYEIVQRDQNDRPFRADTFLEYLNQSHERWLGSEFLENKSFLSSELRSPWIFRGHTNADYKLLPRVWRQDDADVINLIGAQSVGRQTPATADKDTWWAAYYRLLDEFSFRADRIGIHRYVSFKQGFQDQFVRQSFEELEAIAQHSGLPTRLLDWTYDSASAAFFASWKADSEANRGESCCIWALNTTRLDNIDFRRPANDVISPDPIQIQQRKTSYSISQRLKSQAGTFTVAAGEGFPTQWYEIDRFWPAIETMVKTNEQQIGDFMQLHGEPRPLLRKIILPIEECQRLQRLLQLRGVTYSSLFPAFESVAEELRAELLEA